MLLNTNAHDSLPQPTKNYLVQSANRNYINENFQLKISSATIENPWSRAMVLVPNLERLIHLKGSWSYLLGNL